MGGGAMGSGTGLRLETEITLYREQGHCRIGLETEETLLRTSVFRLCNLEMK